MSALEDCEESFSCLLESAAAQIQQGKDVDLSHHTVEMSQRLLAGCALLGEADVDLFIERLDRSGTARLRLLRWTGAGHPCDPKVAAASRALGFFAALASGNLTLATDIAHLLPRAHNATWEYEDDFLFVDFLRQAALGLAQDRPWQGTVAPTLKRWRQVLDGRSSPTFDACNGVSSQDPITFAQGFEAFLASRVTVLDEYRCEVSFDPQVYAAEGNLYIEGMALLEIAARSGLPIEQGYPLIPSAARAVRSGRSGESPDWLRV